MLKGELYRLAPQNETAAVQTVRGANFHKIHAGSEVCELDHGGFLVGKRIAAQHLALQVPDLDFLDGGRLSFDRDLLVCRIGEKLQVKVVGTIGVGIGDELVDGQGVRNWVNGNLLSVETNYADVRKIEGKGSSFEGLALAIDVVDDDEVCGGNLSHAAGGLVIGTNLGAVAGCEGEIVAVHAQRIAIVANPGWAEFDGKAGAVDQSCIVVEAECDAVDVGDIDQGVSEENRHVQGVSGTGAVIGDAHVEGRISCLAPFSSRTVFHMGESVVEADGQGIICVDEAGTITVLKLFVDGTRDGVSPGQAVFAGPGIADGGAGRTGRTKGKAQREEVEIVGDEVIVGISRPYLGGIAYGDVEQDGDIAKAQAGGVLQSKDFLVCPGCRRRPAIPSDRVDIVDVIGIGVIGVGEGGAAIEQEGGQDICVVDVGIIGGDVDAKRASGSYGEVDGIGGEGVGRGSSSTLKIGQACELRCCAATCRRQKGEYTFSDDFTNLDPIAVFFCLDGNRVYAIATCQRGDGHDARC